MDKGIKPTHNLEKKLMVETLERIKPINRKMQVEVEEIIPNNEVMNENIVKKIEKD